MRCLIIGGTSVFGEGLIRRLLEKDDTEIVIATKLPGEEEFAGDRLQWETLDLRNADATNQTIEAAEADIIFDFATEDSVGNSWKNPTGTVDVNVIGTINLLNAVRDYSKKSRLIIGGSGEEYGRMGFDSLPVKEGSIPFPNNIYGATKACQTMFAKLYHQAFGLDIIVLRTFYEISEKQDASFAVSSFCKQFAEIEKGTKEPIIDTGNINNIRDFTDVNDLVRAFDLVSTKGKSGEIYNAARGQGFSLLDIIRVLEGMTGKSVKIHMDSSRVRPMDSPAMVADVSKIEKDCGWKAEIPLEITIGNMLNYWRTKV